MARKDTSSNDLGAELDGFLEKNMTELEEQGKAATLASSRRSGARKRRPTAKTQVRADEFTEGTEEISATEFASKLGDCVREKKAKQERVFNLLNNKTVRSALKEFIDEIGGIDRAYERLIIVAPDVRKSTFVKAWKECGYGSSNATE